jgi:ubiquinol-cytochrome c reductase cytochrome b subunit
MTTVQDARPATKRLRNWLARWTRLAEIEAALFDEPATGLRAWGRTTAGIVVMLIALQFITGALLSFYYVPSAESAHTTVAYIEKVLPAGSWLRALHHYGSQWLTVFLILHLLQMFWRASYRRRPVAWMACIFLLALVLAGGATGYSLPWDARAFFGTRVAEGIAGGLPFVGETMRRWLLGGMEVSTVTVSRFFALHALITPALILLIIAARLFVFRERDATATDESERAETSERARSWKQAQLTRQAVAAGLIFLALALYALKFPAPLGPAASEAASGYLPRPGAQFLWLFQMLKYLPGGIASIIAAALPGLIFISLAALPILEARRRRDVVVARPRKLSVALFAFGFAFFVLMTTMAYVGDARDPRVREQLARQAEEEKAFRAEPFEPQRAGASETNTNSAQPAASPAANTQPLTADTPPASYLKQCANCHGAKGQGVKPFPKLLGVSAKPRRTVEDIIGLLNDPAAYDIEPPMKSFANKLSDKEKREIAEWLMLLKK